MRAGQNWGRDNIKYKIEIKKVYLLVLVHWRRYGVAGCHGRWEKLGMGVGVGTVIVIANTLVLGWWWPSLSLSDAEAGGLSLLLEWGLSLPLLGVRQWAVALILILSCC